MTQMKAVVGVWGSLPKAMQISIFPRRGCSLHHSHCVVIGVDGMEEYVCSNFCGVDTEEGAPYIGCEHDEEEERDDYSE
jgi:hypothetical protein